METKLSVTNCPYCGADLYPSDHKCRHCGCLKFLFEEKKNASANKENYPPDDNLSTKDFSAENFKNLAKTANEKLIKEAVDEFFQKAKKAAQQGKKEYGSEKPYSQDILKEIGRQARKNGFEVYRHEITGSIFIQW